MKQLEFKKYNVGNFYIEKVRRECPEGLFDEFPKNSALMREIKKVIEQAGGVPFIIIGDNIGMWKSEFVMGCGAYQFYDSLETDENGEIIEKGIEEFLSQSFFFNTIIGDSKLMLDKRIAIASYSNRQCEGSSEKTAE